jgi:hypothetical protein
MVAVHGQSRRPLRHLRTRVMDAASSVARATNTRAASAMTYTTEEFVRRELRRILRGDTYRTRFVCLTCLVTMTLGAPTSGLAEVGDHAGGGPNLCDSGLLYDVWGGGRVCSLPENNALSRRGRLIAVEGEAT